VRYLVLIFTCDNYGSIDKVVINNVPELTLEPGHRFIDIFDEANQDKAQLFFLDNIIENATKECELVIKLSEKLLVLYFKAVSNGSEKLIIAESEFDEIISYYAKMMSLNNQLVNSLRHAYKSHASDQDDLQSEQYMAELSSVNNELITTQRELSKKNIELTRLNELKNQLVGMAAHDLRNPLGAISSFSDFILEDCGSKLDPDSLEFLQIIKSTSVYMLKMVEGILDLSYIQSGKIQLNLKRMDYKPFFSNIIRLSSNLAAKKQIRIAQSCASEHCMVNIDEVKIQQVLSNIISNAIKYSPPDTTITIKAHKEYPFIVTQIQDQGYGIPEEEFNLIFEPFKRSSVVKDPGEKSTGLGLAICKNIVEAHRGKIWVESTLDKGSTFYFSLPMA
jgi:signal transduction histidine kinase